MKQFYAILITTTTAALIAGSVQAQETQVPTVAPTLREEERPATTVKEWFAQIKQTENAALVQVTGVQLNRTQTGLEIILETQDGKPLRIDREQFTAEGNTLRANIPNALLRLPSGNEFTAENPSPNINRISINQIDTNRIQIAVVGTNQIPTNVTLRTGELTYSLKPFEETTNLEIVVTRTLRSAYVAPNVTTGTRTDTPTRDIPQSIQAIPRQVIQDQQTIRAEEALRNVSGVTFNGGAEGQGLSVAIRGFTDAPVLIDGFREYGFSGGAQLFPDTANIERVEVLKGPASILFGEVQPGGVVNVVTKRPLSNPLYEAELQLGSYGFVRPRLDFSGPLTEDGRLLYRFNAVYEHSEGFRDYQQDIDRLLVAPVVSWKISDRTDLTVLLQYSEIEQPIDFGRIAVGSRLLDTPRDRIFGEPDDYTKIQLVTVGYDLEHRFSDNWRVRNAFRYSDRYTEQRFAFSLSFDEATGILDRAYGGFDIDIQNYSLQTNIVGEFATGSVKHTLLTGVDLNRVSDKEIGRLDFGAPLPLNVFDPVYGAVPRPGFETISPFFDQKVEVNRIGVYVQDQISLFENLKLLAGIRYDTVEQTIASLEGFFTPTDVKTTETENAFTPRVGIVYQPIPELSVYGSYSRSFIPVTTTSVDGSLLPPEEGQGFEVGFKADLLQNRLSATLAYFDITKQNVATPDPNNEFFSIATGEQRSQGVELDISGEILPGWNIIAAYAYTDAEVTKDNAIPVGNRLTGIPKHSASLWTTYTLQSGNLQGLGVGVGFNYFGEREGDLDNSFQLDSYFLTNAAIFYRRDNWRFALNFRNLFNIDYSPGTPFGRERIEVGEPFTVIGSFSFQF